MIGLALVTAVAVITNSVEASINQALDGTVKAQLVVIAEGSGAFSPEVASTLRADPRLADVSEIRGSDVAGRRHRDQRHRPRHQQRQQHLQLQHDPGLGREHRRPATPRSSNSTEAATENLHLGSVVTMTFPNGDKVPMTVGGIYTPDALISGYLVSLGTLNPHLTTVRDSDVALNPAPGVSLSAADASMLNDLRAYPQLSGLTKAQYKNLISAGLNTFLNLIYVLLGLAIIIAVVGIINTLALSVLERTRELGLLRAVGMTRGQTREMVAWESVIIALLGAVLGLAVGAGLGIALVSSLHSDGISQTAVPGQQPDPLRRRGRPLRDHRLHLPGDPRLAGRRPARGHQRVKLGRTPGAGSPGRSPAAVRSPVPAPRVPLRQTRRMSDPADRQAFAERMRLQLQSRYRGVEVVIDGPAFALRLHGAGVDVGLPLGAASPGLPPRTRAQRQPDRRLRAARRTPAQPSDRHRGPPQPAGLVRARHPVPRGPEPGDASWSPAPSAPPWSPSSRRPCPVL